MNVERRRLGTAFIFATVGFVIAIGIGPVARETIVSAYVLALAAIVLASLTRIAAEPNERRPPSALDHALRPRERSVVRPAALVRIEREITLGTASAGHLHLRLLPLLREAAVARRAGRLSDGEWRRLTDGIPPDGDRNAPGISAARLRRLVQDIEAL